LSKAATEATQYFLALPQQAVAVVAQETLVAVHLVLLAVQVVVVQLVNLHQPFKLVVLEHQVRVTTVVAPFQELEVQAVVVALAQSVRTAQVLPAVEMVALVLSLQLLALQLITLVVVVVVQRVAELLELVAQAVAVTVAWVQT
jgi:hypothetical protein